MSMAQTVRRAWTIVRLSAKRFLQLDGGQWAAAFAFNAFFSLFPMIILFVTLASFFVDRPRAGVAIIAYVEGYVPISGEMRSYIFDALAGVIEARQHASLVALLMLVWTSLQCFITLASVINRAWGNEVYQFWQVSLRGVLLLGITSGAVLMSMAAPVLASMGTKWFFPASAVGAWLYALGGFVAPLLVLFASLTLFYQYAPQRQPRFAYVWPAALCATLLLQVTESLFVVYLKNFATLSAVYGAFGGIMALLLWIYISGCIFIWGACVSATLATSARTSMPNQWTQEQTPGPKPRLRYSS